MNSVLRAGALKYAMTFRNQLPPAVRVQLIPLLISHIPAENTVVATYAASTLEKLFAMRGSSLSIAIPAPLVITEADIAPHIGILLQNLFTVFAKEENEYIMKCIMRTVTSAVNCCQVTGVGLI